jgi:hypothetical protein
MRVRLKGVNRNSKVLADGRRVTYYYAWKGGPPLRGSPLPADLPSVDFDARSGGGFADFLDPGPFETVRPQPGEVAMPKGCALIA